MEQHPSAICSDAQLKERYFPVHCRNCGWIGCSCDTDGAIPIADAGDYTDMECPNCGSTDMNECANDQSQF